MPQQLNFDSFGRPVGLREAVRFASTLGNGKAQKIAVAVAGVFIVVCFFLSLLFWLNAGPAGLVFILFMGVVPTALVIAAAYALLKNSIRALRLKRFAEANGFAFAANKPIAGYPGLIFGIGHSPQYLTIVHGGYEGLSFEFGNFFCTEGSGKNSKRREFGVIEVKLTRRLPHILLDSRANNSLGFSNLPSFRSSQHLTLEGDFNDYFNLYVPDGYERDALYLITPELMALLIDLGANFDIEIVDDRLYIYSSREFSLEKKQTIEQIFKLVGVLGAEVLENSSRYADTNVGDRQANIVAEPGKRLKRNMTWVIIVLVFVFAFIMFLVGVALSTPTP